MKSASFRLRRFVCNVSVLLLCLFFASCTSRAVKRNQALEKSVSDGDFSAAITHIQKNTKLYGETNAFLYYMDIGVLFHYAGMYDSSNHYLEQAAAVYDDLFTKSVTNEAAALLTNDNMRPYRSRPFEIVLMHQFKALNYMAMGKFQESLVETRRVQLHFNEWERTGAKSNKYHSDGMFHLLSSLAYESVGEDDNSLISLYKAVEAYNMGPVRLSAEVRDFAAHRLEAGDREGDLARLKISASDGPGKWSAPAGASEIVIVGYAGKGPNLREQNWSGTYVQDGLLVVQTPGKDGKPNVISIAAPMLPASEYEKASRGEKTKSGTTFYIKLSLPEVQTFTSQTAYFSARVNDASENIRSVIVNDIDSQLTKAQGDIWGEVLTRTAVRVVLRTIAAQKAKGAMQSSSPLLNLVTNLGTDVASSQLEKADVRICFLMPKTIHATRVPVEPGTHSVTLNVHDASGRVIGKKEYANIEVKRGEKKVLLHHSLR
ncbi:MAG: hypothetical protein LBI42_03475 [Chitinispirillales bacterium]|jgi:tetratricopeptide (TPR) repeat protein|nr:hypothetical protein [Chitinispirillales bacterium]